MNWAKIWNGAAAGGGVNGYVQSLATELTARSHEVISLCSGTSYRSDATVARPPGSDCHVVRHRDWQGVKVFEVVNSPVLAPSLAQFRDPLGETGAPSLERPVEQLLKWLSPDVVHFHSLEGLSIGCVDAARRLPSAPRVLFSLHNYHTICSQVQLMQAHRRPCFSFAGGAACSGCVPGVDPDEERRFRAQVPAESEPACTVARPADASSPLPVSGDDRRGQPSYIWHDLRPLLWSGCDTTAPAAQEPLSNRVEPDSNGEATNPYGRRRAAMIAMLNRCDRVLAVSEFVRRKFESLGLHPAAVSTLHIGTRMAEITNGSTREQYGPSIRPGDRPVRMAFLGYNSWYKGLPMLAATLERLPDEVLAAIDLSIVALGGDSLEEQFGPLRRRLAGLTLRGSYRFDEVPALLRDIDVGLVTSVWWDNAPQTVMEFLACGVPVIGAELGGIPDFVHHGHNGLLFRGNDCHDLGQKLTEVVRNPALLGKLQRNITPPKGMAEHAIELERLYRG